MRQTGRGEGGGVTNFISRWIGRVRRIIRKTRLQHAASVAGGIGADKEGPQVFDSAALETLNKRLSHPDGLTVEALNAVLDDYFQRERSLQDVQAYREGSRPWKKLADEVVPVAEYLIRTGAGGFVRFPLDSQPPDAWFRRSADEPWSGIEVTRALARAKYDIARDLRDKPIGRGFLGLPDDAKSEEYERTRKRGRITSSAAGARRSIEAAITERIADKSDLKYAGQTLIVAAPLGSGGHHDWESMRLRLIEAARQTAFHRIAILDDARRSYTPVLVIDVPDANTAS